MTFIVINHLFDIHSINVNKERVRVFQFFFLRLIHKNFRFPQVDQISFRPSVRAIGCKWVLFVTTRLYRFCDTLLMMYMLVAGADRGASFSVRVGPPLRADGPDTGARRLPPMPGGSHAGCPQRTHPQHPRASKVAAAARYHVWLTSLGHSTRTVCSHTSKICSALHTCLRHS